MSVGILSKYIDDLLSAEEEDIQHYLSQMPGGREDLLPLLLAARAAHRAIAAIEVDPVLEGESRQRAQEALASPGGAAGLRSDAAARRGPARTGLVGRFRRLAGALWGRRRKGDD